MKTSTSTGFVGIEFLGKPRGINFCSIWSKNPACRPISGYRGNRADLDPLAAVAKLSQPGSFQARTYAPFKTNTLQTRKATEPAARNTRRKCNVQAQKHEFPRNVTRKRHVSDTPMCKNMRRTHVGTSILPWNNDFVQLPAKCKLQGTREPVPRAPKSPRSRTQ
jgi:hypothetical protein